jgi:hypothetical protein
VIPAGYTPYFLLNLPDDSVIRNNQGAYLDFNSWPKPVGFNPTLDLVKEKYLELIQKTRIRVNQELTQVLQPDALQTLSSAYERSGNRWKLSPMDSLKGIITFLKEHPPKDNNEHFTRLYESTIKKLSEVFDITQTPSITGILWGTGVWGEDWARGAISSKVISGRNLGLARSVQLEFIGPSSQKWGVNSIGYKYQARRVKG